MRRWLLPVCAVLACLVPLRGARAQARPDLAWQELRATHVRVVFEPGLEGLARRVAAAAESAYVALARELVPPRGRVDVVLADNLDLANGFATPFPTNRILLYARPPVDQMALRNHEDWVRLLVTHEMAHLFHLDRVGGLWALGQRVFGRAAPLFPNSYSPSWMLEGLAVHYETKLGGGGRLSGTEFPALARAAALGGALPPLDAVSLGAPRFPRGNSAYLYGAYAMSRGDTTPMARFIALSSRRVFVSRLDATAREAFGVTFEARWRAWRDSVTAAAAVVAAAVDATGVTTRTVHGFTARFPRFVDEATLQYVADDARDMPGLYRVSAEGVRRRIGRRNSVDVSAPAAGGATLTAELDFVDPYTLRSDLYVARGERRVRLGVGERLSHPDLHVASGRVVAVRSVPGATDLVLTDLEGRAGRLLARGSFDRTYAEPRFAHDGSRVAAVRWDRGGRMRVVVLDTAGVSSMAFAPVAVGGGRAVIVSSPVWEPGDSTLLFVSDHDGRAQIYRGDVRTGAYGLIWASATALNTPDVAPDGRRMAAVELRADGYHVVTRPVPVRVPLTRPLGDDVEMPVAPAPVETTAVVRRYAPAGELVPSWWLPVVGPSGPGTWGAGVMTSARDLVGRHAYTASWSRDLARPEVSTAVSYMYAGLGNPIVQVDYGSSWQHLGVRDQSGTFQGWLGERTRRTGLQVTRQRPGVRRASWVSAGGVLEAIDYQTDPLPLQARLVDARYRRTTWSQVVQVGAGFSTMQRPALSVSVEDGLTGSAVVRRRFGGAVTGGDVTEVVGAVTGALALPWPGAAHHVLAARAAAGLTGADAVAGFGVGGVNGSSLAIFPGVVIGGSPRTFGVRGFEAGVQSGTRALAGSVEYRAPVGVIGRGLRGTSFFFQQASVTAFADAGAAWCDVAVTGSSLCRAPIAARRWVGAVGGELALDASLQYDLVYRFRLGVAHAVRGVSASAPGGARAYFSLGATF